MSTVTLTPDIRTSADRPHLTPRAIDVAVMLDAAQDDGFEQPCRTHDPDLWFAESPTELEQAKQLCSSCPVRSECLAAALARHESCGVWGGEILQRGVILPRKRPRGRPRKDQSG